MGVYEVYPGLILGGINDLDAMVRMRTDILVPLDRLSARVWELGFRGEILYCPIRDYSFLPDDVLERLVDQIVERHVQGKRVAIFCLGGHGRTGYVAACVLFRLGIQQPIEYLRNRYNPSYIETREQEAAIRRFCTQHDRAQTPRRHGG